MTIKLNTLTAKALLALALLAPASHAASLNQTFMNDFASNAMYFWADDAANLGFGQVQFGANMGDWTVTANDGAALVIAGSTVGAGAGRFTLQLDYETRPFALQWAEVFFDNGINRLLGAGTLTYLNGWSGSDVFTHAADVPHQFSAQASVPLPQSVVMLLSALVFLPLRRLQRVRART